MGVVGRRVSRFPRIGEEFQSDLMEAWVVRQANEGKRRVGGRRIVPLPCLHRWPTRYAMYSRSVRIPGCGMAYFPSGPARIGAGPSIVSLSTLGANSCSQLSICS